MSSTRCRVSAAVLRAHGPDGTALYIADYAGAVSLFSVESNIEMLYAQFLATNPIALSVPRELQPVTA